jgi:hypothetical protein
VLHLASLNERRNHNTKRVRMRWFYRGSKSLLAVIVVFNLANISMFTSAIRGPETWLAGHPTMITTVIFGQIVATLALVWFFARAENQPTIQNAATA